MTPSQPPLGVAEATEILGCGRTWVLHLIKTKRIRATKLPGRTAAYLLNRSDVDALAAKKAERLRRAS